MPLLTTIGRLAIAAQHHAIASRQLLERPAMLKFTREIVAAVVEEIRPLPDSEAILDRIVGGFESRDGRSEEPS